VRVEGNAEDGGNRDEDSDSESSSESNETDSLVEDADEKAEMRAFVRSEGPTTRRMAKNSLASVNGQIKIMQVFITILFVGLLLTPFIFSNAETKPTSVHSGDKIERDLDDQDEDECWAKFKEEKCSIDDLRTPLCKRLYECSFGSAQKPDSTLKTLLSLLVVAGILCILCYYFPEKRQTIFDELWGLVKSIKRRLIQ
jgi:hypothetical protein